MNAKFLATALVTMAVLETARANILGWAAARFDLAVALNGSGDVEGAVNELLDLFKRDRDWNAGAAKTQLLTIFDSLSPKDPIALAGRRRLSSMIFV